MFVNSPSERRRPKPNASYLWRTFVNTLPLSLWNKWHPYTPLQKRAGRLERKVISTFIFFTISFFRRVWSRCKLEIRRRSGVRKDGINSWSGSSAPQWLRKAGRPEVIYSGFATVMHMAWTFYTFYIFINLHIFVWNPNSTAFGPCDCGGCTVMALGSLPIEFTITLVQTKN